MHADQTAELTFSALRHGRRFALATIAALLLCTSAAHAAEPVPTLFGVPAGAKTAGPAAVAPVLDRAVARARPVTVEFKYLDPRSDKAATAIGVELFDGQFVIVDRAGIDERGPGSYAWHGKVRGYGHSDAILTVVDGQIAGSIVVADEATRTTQTYRILSITGGTQTLQLVDPAGFPPDHPPNPESMPTSMRTVRAPGAAVLDAHTLENGSADMDAVAVIDLMVVYGNQTAAAVSTTIGAQIQHAVDRANLAYANSGVAAQLRLVHYGHLSYDESGDFRSDLDRLTSGDGNLEQAHVWRNVYGADLVSLFVENSDYCGLGWIDANAERAFTVVNRGCAGSNLSLAHELGHNFGARHDPDVDSANTPYSYGHGYVDPSGGWRTVMAYNNAANSPRIAYFSNPNLNYGSPPAPMGTASTSDVARVHNERAHAVANFRQPTAAASPSACVVSATPSFLPIAGGTVTVSGSCTDGGTPTHWSWTRNASLLDSTSAVFADTLPANDGASASTYTYAGTACNGNSCAPSVAAIVMVIAPPLVTKSETAIITSSEATLIANVTSNGASTAVTFQYGPTTAYGSSVAAIPDPLPAGAVRSRVSATISGLSCNTTYHFFAAAVNSAGTTRGSGEMFTTGACATANARLDNLTLSAGALSPSFVGNLSPPFASTLQTYSALVVGTPIVIVATLADPAATVKVNGMAVMSGSPSAPIALNPGNNVITVVVTAQDGVTTRTYTINVLFLYVDDGLVEVIEFYNASLDHYFVTWVADEIAALDAGTVVKGWERTGRSFKASRMASDDTSPICRYYIPPALGNSHYFGRGTVECNAAGQNNPSFVLEDPAFMHMYLPTAGACFANTTPVYRVFSNRPDANHRYTTDRALRAEMMAKGWLAEGDGPDLVVMCAPQ